jgi:hypothetical protein
MTRLSRRIRRRHAGSARTRRDRRPGSWAGYLSDTLIDVTVRGGEGCSPSELSAPARPGHGTETGLFLIESGNYADIIHFA